MIRLVTPEDAADICGIYNYFVEHTTITFEEQPVALEEMRQRICEIESVLPWLVWVEEGQLQGFCYASKWKGRSAYRYSVESTIYLHPKSVRRGIGTQLYGALLDNLRQKGLHVVIGGIALPNQASVALHEKLGFRKVACFEQVGWKFDEWIDVGYWHLFLNGITEHGHGHCASRVGRSRPGGWGLKMQWKNDMNRFIAAGARSARESH
jgi:L-amino acid N-acyltransferase YncA